MGIAYYSKRVCGLQCEKRGGCCLLIHRLWLQDTHTHLMHIVSVQDTQIHKCTHTHTHTHTTKACCTRQQTSEP